MMLKSRGDRSANDIDKLPKDGVLRGGDTAIVSRRCYSWLSILPPRFVITDYVSCYFTYTLVCQRDWLLVQP